MTHSRKKLVVAMAMIGATYASAVYAADDDAASVERVEVTGSNLRRISQQGAQPVTVINTEELTRQGITSVEQAMQTLSTNSSAITSNQSVGQDTGGASFADLRGLGQQYTLVLLDGRRLANQAIDGTAVDLNAIPLATIARIEVLRDGASAIYGTDAIGGVINFITKKSLQGATIEANFSDPQHKGGIHKEVSVTGGYGNLAEQGWNVYGSFSASKDNEIKTQDRDFAISRLSPNGVSNYTWPFNYADNSGTVSNPTAPNCAPPYSIYSASKEVCRAQTPLFYGIQPQTSQITGFGKATYAINENNQVALQYVGTQTRTMTKIAPTPLAADVPYTLNPGDKYYPTDLPAFREVTSTDPDTGEETTTNVQVNGKPITLYGRSIPLGPRIDKDVSTTQRIVASAEGTIGAWDYRGGLAYSQNEVKHYLAGGYLDPDLLRTALTTGTINPFSTDTTGWDTVSLGGLVEDDKYKTTMADFHVGRDLFQLPAGTVPISIGVEARHESLSSDYTDLAKKALSSGLEDSEDTSGSRNAQAISFEMNIPIVKNLDATIAVRDDHFSDFGNTINPKIALTYRPVKELMFRGSASTGFRAPSLYDIYQPDQSTFTAAPYDDPLLCPGGNVNLGAGGNKARDCANQMHKQIGGSTNLEPEKSNSITFGFVVEPTKSLTASVDFYWTHIRNTIGVLSESAIFADPVKYADRYVRDASDNHLLYVVDNTQNLGNTEMSGVDVNAQYTFPKGPLGNFGLTFDGSYITKFDYQLEKGGEYFGGVGKFSDYNNAPIFRWKHNLALNWSMGPWSAIIGSTFESGYHDEYEGNDVASYTLWNTSVTYVWQKNLTITAGVKNVFDKEPPYSNQDYMFQVGYDPRYTDSIGRAYFIQASYKM
ncbi:TonB-dependent receptor [Amantichitinum ursilacus]|uniref:Colicin I receptor n=1 Tax=Amantichitinum ursilacus TaxID=857265 RepID=A0A0N0GPI3_9NEIS|nr:TonB-dependent receptor [Amantichitinum ursilacus]KPC53723.1 Colicin I receptor precursor [Amantichitinum ursilacus]